MDLAKAEPRRIAALIITGRLELGEVSFRRRSMVEACVKTLLAEAAAKAKAKAAATARKKLLLKKHDLKGEQHAKE